MAKKLFGIMLDDEDKGTLSKAAIENKTTMSNLARLLIRDGLKHLGGRPVLS